MALLPVYQVLIVSVHRYGVDFVLYVRVRDGSFPMIEKPRTMVGHNNIDSIETIISIDSGKYVLSLTILNDDDDFLFIVCLLFVNIMLKCLVYLMDGWGGC